MGTENGMSYREQIVGSKDGYQLHLHAFENPQGKAVVLCIHGMEEHQDRYSKCDLIDRVVLFGSCLEERCRETSDIDIAVFGNQPRSRALTSKKYEQFARQLYSFDNFSQDYDILYFRSGAHNTSPILQDISKGEELYAKQ